jgi:hypothetical protein
VEGGTPFYVSRDQAASDGGACSVQLWDDSEASMVPDRRRSGHPPPSPVPITELLSPVLSASSAAASAAATPTSTPLEAPHPAASPTHASAAAEQAPPSPLPMPSTASEPPAAAAARPSAQGPPPPPRANPPAAAVLPHGPVGRTIFRALSPPLSCSPPERRQAAALEAEAADASLKARLCQRGAAVEAAAFALVAATLEPHAAPAADSASAEEPAGPAPASHTAEGERGCAEPDAAAEAEAEAEAAAAAAVQPSHEAIELELEAVRAVLETGTPVGGAAPLPPRPFTPAQATLLCAENECLYALQARLLREVGGLSEQLLRAARSERCAWRRVAQLETTSASAETESPAHGASESGERWTHTGGERPLPSNQPQMRPGGAITICITFYAKQCYLPAGCVDTPAKAELVRRFYEAYN